MSNINNLIKIVDNGKLKTSEIIELMKKKFDVWSYYDNNRLDTDFPPPQLATERQFLDSVEPDEETLGMSTTEAEDKGFTNGITLRERLIMELEYFERTGEHLDIKGVTFCTGSRLSGGCVPCVRWDPADQTVDVCWCHVGDSDGANGLRSAVSLDSNSSNSLILEQLEEIKTIISKIEKKIK